MHIPKMRTLILAPLFLLPAVSQASETFVAYLYNPTGDYFLKPLNTSRGECLNVDYIKTDASCFTNAAPMAIEMGVFEGNTDTQQLRREQILANAEGKVVIVNGDISQSEGVKILSFSEYSLYVLTPATQNN